jgi:hypothetical protein
LLDDAEKIASENNEVRGFFGCDRKVPMTGEFLA